MAEDTNETVEHEEQAAVENAEPVAEEHHPLHDRLAKIEEDLRKIKAKLHHM